MLKLGPKPTFFSAGARRPLGSHTETDNHPLQDSAGPVVLNAFTTSLLLVLKQNSIPSITINSVHEKCALILVQQPLRCMAGTKQKKSGACPHSSTPSSVSCPAEINPGSATLQRNVAVQRMISFHISEQIRHNQWHSLNFV